MFIIIPTGHEQDTVRRWPWITLSLIAVNVLLFLLVGLQGVRSEKQISRRLERVFEYWLQRPYLQIPPALVRENLSRRDQERIKIIREAFQHAKPVDSEERARQQGELNRLAQQALAAIDKHPAWSWGLIPTRPTLLAFLTCMFMHAGWLHLFSNMFMFFLSGPAVEDVFGRPLFSALYLGGGVFASLTHLLIFPSSDNPLIGASGAIAAVMGAFMVRFARTRIRFFYIFFFIRGGTFTAPAWFTLGLWLLQQLFYASLVGERAGVAYAAHAGGFLAGAAAALVIRHFRVEERVINPAIEEKISLQQHGQLERGMAALMAGEFEAAREALSRALAEEPRNPDIHLALWQTYVNEGRAADGAQHLEKVIDHSIRTGEYTSALEHWRELRQRAGVVGAALSRWRLAAHVASISPEAEIEILRTFVGDFEAEALAEKAARRLQTLGVSVERTPVAPALPDEPAFAFEEPRGADRDEEESQTFEIEAVTLEACSDDGLLLRGGEAGTELASFANLTAVAVVGITGPGKPYLLIDLVTKERQRVRVLRLLSSQFDPRHVVGREDLSPLAALRALLTRIVSASNAVMAAGEDGLKGGRFPMFETVASYEEAVLTQFKVGAA